MTVGILLLAAGSARRFGADKRLAQLPDGRGVLDTTLCRIAATGLPLLVCLGRDDAPLESDLRARDIRSRLCQQSAQGMGGTLAEGIGALPDWQGVLIALADMPWIETGTYLALAEALLADRICLPVYRGQRGHPVGFGRDFFAELRALEADSGARALLARHPASSIEIAVADPGILSDVDVPADLLH